jgi:predicted DNA-binding transcriptional regulator YafY
MRADRLITIMLLLRARGKMTTQALAEELAVSRRTVLRDIEALSMAGVPLYTDAGHGGGVALDEKYRLSLTGLKESEVRALFVTSNARLLADVGLGEAAGSTLLKLFAALPSPQQDAAAHVRQRIYIDPTWWWHGRTPLANLPILQQAIYAEQRVDVIYERHDGAVVARRLEPYGLVAKASIWYLVALREVEMRTYRISRIAEVKLLAEHFTRSSDFDLPAYWESQVQEFLQTLTQFSFTLRIHSRCMHLIRWYAQGSYEILTEMDGGGWFTARFAMESIDPARMLVLALGANAVVLEPVALQSAVYKTVVELQQAYPPELP